MKNQNLEVSAIDASAILCEPVPQNSRSESRSPEFEVQGSEFKVQSSESQVQASPSPTRVTLCDGGPGLRAVVQIETHAPPPAEFKNQNSKIQNPPPLAVLDFIASDDTLDRYGEILEPTGWRLDNYRRNPVFQNAHQYGDILFTLGKALVTEVREVAGHDGRVRLALYQRTEFAVEANPLARIAYALYQGKFLNAVSVGFIPLRWQDASSSPSSSSSSSSSPPVRRRYLEMELLEVSAVGIPANPSALQLGLQAGAIAKTDVRDVLDLLRALFDSKSKQFRSNPAGVATNTSAVGVNANEAQLLRLARALRELLRRA